MITQWTAALMAASLVGGQMPSTPASGVQSGIATSGNAAPSGNLMVPAGTLVALTLMTPIQSRTTNVGDTVRAVVAFPVTIGARVAIPSGTYVEGMVNEVSKHGPSVKLHFTRMLFANGYSVPLDALNTQATVDWPALPGSVPQRVGELAWGAGPPPLGVTHADQTYPPNPTLPPLPDVGPSKGAIIGGAIGGVAAIILIAALTTHRHGNSNFVMFASGWQFQMTLTTPLALDPARLPATS